MRWNLRGQAEEKKKGAPTSVSTPPIHVNPFVFSQPLFPFVPTETIDAAKTENKKTGVPRDAARCTLQSAPLMQTPEQAPAKR